ncbi:hypothetical protein L914_02583 [Phytophthora nicotianae]|uniref:Uncharacterized protein n=2 Tax=Phytophthora nicotianae TaxID=4792 RepID=V9FSL5_PHYNI|nr:hypothetical protein F443_02711 [Phytophthora nicotianae P1569]ETM54014.1 hypothetical protein L914_02583 [Phytophthora nicotianae]
MGHNLSSTASVASVIINSGQAPGTCTGIRGSATNASCDPSSPKGGFVSLLQVSKTLDLRASLCKSRLRAKCPHAAGGRFRHCTRGIRLPGRSCEKIRMLD